MLVDGKKRDEQCKTNNRRFRRRNEYKVLYYGLINVKTNQWLSRQGEWRDGNGVGSRYIGFGEVFQAVQIEIGYFELKVIRSATSFWWFGRYPEEFEKGKVITGLENITEQ